MGCTHLVVWEGGSQLSGECLDLSLDLPLTTEQVMESWSSLGDIKPLLVSYQKEFPNTAHSK